MLGVSGHGIGAKTIQGLEQMATRFGLPLFGVLVLLKHGPDVVSDFLPDLPVVKVPAGFTTPFTTRLEQILSSWTVLPEKILAAAALNELEDIYLPYRPKRRTFGTRRAGNVAPARF